MKKLFFAVVFTAITMTGANAQTFGAKAGLNMSNFRFSGDQADANKEGQSSKIGFAIGGFAEFEISDKLTFQPELLFSTQGSKYSVSGTNFAGSFKNEDILKLSYINIPLIAKYYVSDNFNIQFGPQVGLLMAANVDYTYEQTGAATQTGSSDVKDSYKGVDFGVDFGAGYKLDNGLSLDLRYNLGLSDLADTRASGDNNKGFNNVIQFTIGYALSK